MRSFASSNLAASSMARRYFRLFNLSNQKTRHASARMITPQTTLSTRPPTISQTQKATVAGIAIHSVIWSYRKVLRAISAFQRRVSGSLSPDLGKDSRYSATIARAFQRVRPPRGSLQPQPCLMATHPKPRLSVNGWSLRFPDSGAYRPEFELPVRPRTYERQSWSQYLEYRMRNHCVSSFTDISHNAPNNATFADSLGQYHSTAPHLDAGLDSHTLSRGFPMRNPATPPAPNFDAIRAGEEPRSTVPSLRVFDANLDRREVFAYKVYHVVVLWPT